MYSHPGEYLTDFCIVRQGETYHLFHIRGERGTWPLGYREIDLGHATSSDLGVWTPQAPVLPAGLAGAWDECGIWAPHIVEADETYYLFYTGSDRANNQQIGLATSTDLYTWTKHPDNPLVTPGTWSDRHVGRNVAGRDPMVFTDTGPDGTRFLMYYTATMADGRACLALAESSDLVRWSDLGPTYIEEDRSYNRLESPYLVEQGGRYYLFYSAKGGPNSKGHTPADFAHFDIVYLVSSHPTGGWTRPPNHELLVGWTCASEHPTFDGTTYMFYVIQELVGDVWGASVLSCPKQVEWDADGWVRIVEYLPDNVIQTPLFMDTEHAYSGWSSHGGCWLHSGDGLSARSEETAAWLMDTLWGKDLAYEAEIRGTAGTEASLVVRGNPSALTGYRICLDFTTGTVRLYARFPGRPDTLLQSRPVALNLEGWNRLKVVAKGAFMEIFVQDQLTLVRHDPLHPEGCFGLEVRGDAHFRQVRAYRYREPTAANDDWQRHCRPRHLFAQPE